MPFVCLSDESYNRISKYAEVAGKPMDRAASEVITKWMDSTGDDVIYTLEQRRKNKKKSANKVVPMQAPQNGVVSGALEAVLKLAVGH